MKVRCRLRDIRGERRLRAIAEESGVAAGQLSLLEQGRSLPRDRDLERLEAAYGKPVEEWYSRRTLVAITEEDDT